MDKIVTNYRRFYALFRKLPIRGDREECRRQLVAQYTMGRTDSLREMEEREYRQMCSGIEEILGSREELRKKRSVCLKLMQQLGIDTTDWSRVDKFCSNPRITGKRFAWLDSDELTALSRKLRAIKDKKEKQ